jgi:hypothetical protein
MTVLWMGLWCAGPWSTFCTYQRCIVNDERNFVAHFFIIPWLLLVYSKSHWSTVSYLVNTSVENSEVGCSKSFKQQQSISSVFGEQKFAKLEICARNLSGVQQLAGPWNSLENRSEMSERRRQRAGYRGEGNEEEVICPKPRRATNGLGPATEFMKPSRRRQRCISLNTLNINMLP